MVDDDTLRVGLKAAVSDACLTLCRQVDAAAGPALDEVAERISRLPELLTRTDKVRGPVPPPPPVPPYP